MKRARPGVLENVVECTVTREKQMMKRAALEKARAAVKHKRAKVEVDFNDD